MDLLQLIPWWGTIIAFLSTITLSLDLQHQLLPPPHHTPTLLRPNFLKLHPFHPLPKASPALHFPIGYMPSYPTTVSKISLHGYPPANRFASWTRMSSPRGSCPRTSRKPSMPPFNAVLNDGDSVKRTPRVRSKWFFFMNCFREINPTWARWWLLDRVVAAELRNSNRWFEDPFTMPPRILLPVKILYPKSTFNCKWGLVQLPITREHLSMFLLRSMHRPSLPLQVMLIMVMGTLWGTTITCTPRKPTTTSTLHIPSIQDPLIIPPCLLLILWLCMHWRLSKRRFEIVKSNWQFYTGWERCEKGVEPFDMCTICTTPPNCFMIGYYSWKIACLETKVLRFNSSNTQVEGVARKESRVLWYVYNMYDTTELFHDFSDIIVEK